MTKRELVWFLVGCGVVFSALAPCCCHAGLWAPLSFTASGDDSLVGRATRYELLIRNQAGSRWREPARHDSLGGLAVPDSSGRPDQVLYRVPDTGSVLVRLLVIDDAGNTSPPGNANVLAWGRPDTNYVDQSTLSWARSDSQGLVRFVRELGDSAWLEQMPGRPPWAGAPIVASQEQLQRADRVTLCNQFGYWALRGARQSCGPQPSFLGRVWGSIRGWFQ